MAVALAERKKDGKEGLGEGAPNSRLAHRTR